MALTDRDKKMLIALGVIAALAAVYLFLVVLPGGGGSDVEPPVVQPTESVTPTASPTSTETPRPTSPPIDLVGDRDPFSIPPGLSPSPTGGGVSPSGGTVSPTSPTSPPPTSPTSPPPTSPPPTSPPPTSPPPTSPPPPVEPDDHILIGGHDVRLLDVFANGKRVQIEVDGRVYTVEEGATFDDNFKLVKILDHHCARFLFGDQSFELCAQAKK
ncbi:MAG: hypothetical protein ACM3WR_04730 [Solirubrobacterales bacterium]|jgi:hypothetical protein